MARSFGDIWNALLDKVSTMKIEDIEEEISRHSRHDMAEVMEKLVVAVNKTTQTNIYLRSVTHSVQTRNKLCTLLRQGEQWSQFFKSDPDMVGNVANAKSPVNIAECLTEVPQRVVKNLIDHQFAIKWNTDTGEPDDYTFYDFCNHADDPTQYLKYTPRKAHVRATLYKECKIRPSESLQKEQLCPTVYIRVTDNSWKLWTAVNPDSFNDSATLPEWINENIRNFIEQNAEKQELDNDSLKRVLKKPTLYWAVLNDTDFKRGENLNLKEIGKTQVYVGRATNGIQRRWLSDGSSHCSMMMKCLENMRDMTTYNPLREKKIQLVDARLALASVRQQQQQQQRQQEEETDNDNVVQEETALFVMKTFGEILKGKTKAEKKAIEKLLKDAEKSHRNGETVDEPKKDIIDNIWTPKKMQYGMNCK